MDKSSNKLKTEGIVKLCFMMAIPCVLAQLVNLLYNIIDRIYIGNMSCVGKDALAGLGLCSPIIILISAFASFTSGGGAPLSSKSLGEHDDEKARKILGNSVFLLLIFSSVLMIIFYIIRKPLLHLIGGSDVTIPYATAYLDIYLIGTFFVLLSVGLNTFITAQGKAIIAMVSVLIGAILNIVLDPLFIFTFNMGIKGAALATIISQMVSCCFILIVLFNKNNILHIEFKNLKPDKAIIISIFSLGIASFVMSATESLIGFFLNSGLKKYGGDIYVSLLTVLQSSMLLISTPLSGFTQGVTPVISYNYGALDKKRVVKAFKVSFLVCLFYSMALALLMMIIPRFFGSFYTDDKELLDLCCKYLPIFIFGMLIFGMQRACQTTFVALGEAKISLFIALLRKVILLIPLSLIFPKFMGVGGIYLAEGVADSIAASLCITIFIFRFKYLLKKMEIKYNNML